MPLGLTQQGFRGYGILANGLPGRRGPIGAAEGVGKMKEREFFGEMRKKGISLSPVQEEAVRRTEGPVLLLAVPGSGKTTTVISRIGYLMQVKGCDPKRIKAVTFSRAAAEDMKERFAKWFPDLPKPGFSTLHSLAFEVAREDFRRRGMAFRVLEGTREDEGGEGAVLNEGREGEAPAAVELLSKRRILRQLYKTAAGELPAEDRLDELATWIGCMKNGLVPESEWSRREAGLPHAAQVLRAFERFKADYPGGRLVDYDDMLTLANEALERDARLLQRYQDRYDYLLTDESQDNSLVQHAIVEKLARRHRNLCVVADDDQSIYGWRGAEPGYLLEFRRAYPDAALLYMEHNFRSSQEIVRTANEFIKRNRNRYAKNMTTPNPGREPIRFRSFAEYAEQAKQLVGEIRQAPDLAEVAILYRNNHSASALINRLDRAGIPFRVKDRDEHELHHWVVEDILNFMRLTFTERRPEILEKVHLKMNGYISRQQMAEVRERANGEPVFDCLLNLPSLQDYQIRPITEARDTLRALKGSPPLAAIRTIRSELGYDKALDKQCARLGAAGDYLFDLLDTLEDIAEPLSSMEEFAERIAYLRTRLAKPGPRKDQPAVTLSTFHSAKGLEFDRVYLIDLVEGVFPSEDDADPGRMEEAVRLFYVGMTRARERLELMAYRSRGKKKLTESRFMRAVRELTGGAEGGAARKAGQAAGGQTTRPNSGRPGGQRSPAAMPTGTRPGGARTAGTQAAKPPAAGPPARPSAVPQARPPAMLRPEAQRLLAQLSVGARVKHQLVGIGEVGEVSRDTILIRFGSEARKFSLPVCLEMGLLEPLPGPA